MRFVLAGRKKGGGRAGRRKREVKTIKKKGFVGKEGDRGGGESFGGDFQVGNLSLSLSLSRAGFGFFLGWTNGKSSLSLSLPQKKGKKNLDKGGNLCL